MRVPNQYKIVRRFERDDQRPELIARGLSLQEAHLHCRSPEARSETAQDLAARFRTQRLGPWCDNYENDDGPWSRGYSEPRD